MNRNLLLEIGTEEVPSSFIPKAMEDLARLAKEHLDGVSLSYKEVSALGTPRRLALCVKDLSCRQPDREEVVTGPPAKIAFTPDGDPTKAGEGFARSQGVGVDKLQVEERERGAYVVVRRLVSGRDTIELLSELLPKVITSIPFPKKMWWEAERIRFPRPIRWLVALYGEDRVPFSLAGVTAGSESYGHRFMAPGVIQVPSDLTGYVKVLEEAFVLVDPITRRERLLEGANSAIASVGGNLLHDDELVEINTYLTEFPSAICGSFDKRFLDLPREVLVTCMREHQRYFAVVDDKGNIMPYFVAINNTRSPRPELVCRGHERVLKARLSDADFFFREDQKRPLEDLVPDLSGMVFHQGLGTILDKTYRVKALASYLARQIAPDKLDVVERAAWLCKADLLTEMVGEFPSLQGVMGREYAILSGEDIEVADAIKEHYMPVRSGGELPTRLPGALLSIADKVDTICATFAIGLRPSGTADPYGLRRMALGILHIIEDKSPSLSLKDLIAEALAQLGHCLPELPEGLSTEILTFFRRRLSHDLVARGLEQDIVEAATRVEFDDIVNCILKARALAAVRSRPEFEPLSIAFKRVMNILKGFEGRDIDPHLLEAEEEKALYETYLSVEKRVKILLETQDYEQALVALLSLKPGIDSFFDHVLVMAKDLETRANRLALLWNIARLFLQIGDLSAIVGTES